VEPKYEKKLETLDYLLDSEIVYCTQSLVSIIQDILSYPELAVFVEHSIHKENSSHVRKCPEIMITKRNLAYINTQIYATVTRDLGTVDVGKIVCSLDENLVSVSLIVLFKKGNTLLHRFNILMKCYLEPGLLERLWSKLQHRASLKGGGRFREADRGMFLTLFISHLMPTFVILTVGTILSSVVFIGELILNCLCKRRKQNRTLGE
jgi:hypothetical protein